MQVILTLEEYQKLTGERDKRVEDFMDKASTAICEEVRLDMVRDPNEFRSRLSRRLWAVRKEILNPDKV